MRWAGDEGRSCLSVCKLLPNDDLVISVLHTRSCVIPRKHARPHGEDI